MNNDYMKDDWKVWKGLRRVTYIYIADTLVKSPPFSSLPRINATITTSPQSARESHRIKVGR